MEHILACPSCNTPNRFGQRLCGSCGHDLSYRCSRCQVDIDPGMSYCPYCGEISAGRSKGRSLASDEPSKKPDLVLEVS